MPESNPRGEHGENMVVRRGRVAWLTHPPEGTAHMSVQSGAFGHIALSVPVADPVPHEATPGELLAVTHGFFLLWTLAEALVAAGAQAHELTVEAACSFAGSLTDRTLRRIELNVVARVPGLDPLTFDQIVDRVRERYAEVGGLRGDATVHAELLG
jgi:hypothetical protein